jgi:hypothetical protein
MVKASYEQDMQQAIAASLEEDNDFDFISDDE